MSDGLLWLGLLGMMAMTLLTRSGAIVWPGPIKLPARVQRALRYAPMAAIAAVIVPTVLFGSDGMAVGLLHPQTIAALAALLAWWFWRQMAICLLVGILAYTLSKLLI